MLEEAKMFLCVFLLLISYLSRQCDLFFTAGDSKRAVHGAQPTVPGSGGAFPVT